MQQSRGAAAENCVALEDTGGAGPTHQMVLLRESGMAQPAIAAAMGVSLSAVNRAQRRHLPLLDQADFEYGMLPGLP